MTARILGLHHVTATVDDAQADLDYCLDALGLRLVKKTVNFDNHHVYHFYYGDAAGTPGTIWTTFPYRGHGVRTGVKGAGQVTATSFSVPAASIAWWRERLASEGVDHLGAASRFGEDVLTMDDPSGLRMELIGSANDVRQGWTFGGVGAEAAIHGLHSVTMTLAAPGPSVAFMERWLGFGLEQSSPDRLRLGVNGGGPGRTVDIAIAPQATPAVNGLGTVHHVAMAIGSAEEQLELREALVAAGVRVTEVRDRQYFLSIYFREPGGVLFEVATMKPGFAVDEAPEALGRELKLPPWEEPYRTTIEAGLDRVSYRA